MNKTLSLFILMIVLAAGIFYLTKKEEQQLGRIREGDRLFRIENTDEVYKLFIASRTSKPVTLTRMEDHWVLNDQYRANQDVIDGTLMALRAMELSFIPTQNAYDHIMKELATRGIKVEAYDKSGKRIRSFYIGGTSPDGLATQMIVDGYDQPYMMKLKGRDGSIRPQFEKKFDDWRDRNIFRNISKQLDTFKLIYPTHKDESFQITARGDGFVVEPIFKTTNQGKVQAPKSIFQRYFYEIEKFTAEAYKNDWKERDKVMQAVPFATLYLKKKDGQIKIWDFIPHRVYDHEKAFDGDLFEDRVVFRYFIRDRDGDLLFGQRQLLNHLFWGYTYFFEKK